MNKYRIILKHDNGRVKITTWATRMTQAVRQVLNAERAPFRAIKQIEKVR